MTRLSPLLLVPLALGAEACVKKPPTSPLQPANPAVVIGATLHDRIDYCLDNNPMTDLPEIGFKTETGDPKLVVGGPVGLMAHTDFNGIPLEVTVRKDSNLTVVTAEYGQGDQSRFDRPLLDEGNDGVPDRMWYENAWYRIAPADQEAYQESYNQYLGVVWADAYCKTWEDSLQASGKLQVRP